MCNLDDVKRLRRKIKDDLSIVSDECCYMKIVLEVNNCTSKINSYLKALNRSIDDGQINKSIMQAIDLQFALLTELFKTKDKNISERLESVKENLNKIKELI